MHQMRRLIETCKPRAIEQLRYLLEAHGIYDDAMKLLRQHLAEKVKLTPEQKKALAAYNFALQQEDRYLGSVFVNPSGQREKEAKTKAAYDRCKALGMTHEHGL
jgi:hypothetical protein